MTVCTRRDRPPGRSETNFDLDGQNSFLSRQIQKIRPSRADFLTDRRGRRSLHHDHHIITTAGRGVDKSAISAIINSNRAQISLRGAECIRLRVGSVAQTREPDTASTVGGKDAHMGCLFVSHCTWTDCNAVILFLANSFELAYFTEVSLCRQKPND